MLEESVLISCYPKGEFQDTLVDDRDGRVIWQTPWQRNLIVNGMKKALATGLVKGGSAPLQFWVVGNGKEEWDKPGIGDFEKFLVEERVNLTTLYKEVIRKTITPKQLSDNPNKVEVSADFRIEDLPKDANPQIREFGLIAGDILINHRVHARIDLQTGFILKRTLHLTF